jgi:threonine/homoserine/homoserine lactone efflux protein
MPCLQFMKNLMGNADTVSMNNGSKYGRSIAIFILGCALFCFPVLSIFNIKSLILGIPVLFVYLFAAWTGLLVLIYLASKTRIEPPEPKEETKPAEPPPVLFDSVG